MADPVETFLGWSGLGFGVLLAYGAYKNKPVLGPTGLLTTSLRTGVVPTAGGNPAVGPPQSSKPNPGWNPLTGAGLLGPHVHTAGPNYITGGWNFLQHHVGAPIRHLFGGN